VSKKASQTVFANTVQPFIDHKNAYQDYKGRTEGGIPITKQQEKIEKNRRFQKDYFVDPVTAPFQALFNKIPGIKGSNWEAGKQNWLIQSKADKAQRQSELENFRVYREKRDDVRDKVIEIADAARKKYEETGDKKFLDLAVQGTNDLLAASNLQMKDFITVDPETLAMRDGMGLLTNNPNPYPVVETGMYIGGGIYGSVKGEQLMRRNFFTNPKNAQGKYSKGNWLSRSVGVVLGGATGTAAADYGYEVMLDIMSRAGQAKQWMKDDPGRASIADAMLAEVIPDSMDFGPQGINRPDQKTRIGNAINAFKWDAAITSAFFGARPLYYALRQGVGSVPFRMFKDKKVPGVYTSKELLDAEQEILKRWMPKDGPKEKLVFANPLGIPRVGEFLTRLTNSRAFNWLGPTGSVKHNGKEWFPEAAEIPGTMMSRTMAGGRIGRAVKGAMAPTPLFGIGISKSLGEQSDFYVNLLKDKMIGSFAPYANAFDMGIEWTKLASANMRGFRAYARKLEDDFTKAAEGMGKGFSDYNLVSNAKQILKEYREKLQIDPKVGAYADDVNANLIPQQVSSKLIKFLEEQIIKPLPGNSTHTMRSVQQMKGLREQMDDLLKPLEDATLAKTTYADDITRLFKAWEADIGSVAQMGYPEVAKAFQAYDNFVSKGMLLYGTDVGQSIANVSKRGFSINIDESTTRAGQGLFEVVTNAAKSKPRNAYPELAAIRRIVGDRGYHNGVGTYIRNAFHKAISEDQGIMKFDADAFRSAIGIGQEGSALKSLMSEALPGPKVTKLKIFDPKTGIFKEFDDELYETGVNKGIKDILGEEVPEGLLKAESRQLPTIKELEELTDILERLFADGIPNTAKFMMRRSIMGGFSNAIRSVMPTKAFGSKAAAGAAGFAAGSLGIGAWSMLGATWLVNYGGKVLTNPVSMRVMKNALNTNLPETVRLQNMFRIVRMYPEEWMQFDADLVEMEAMQRKQDMREQAAVTAGSTTERIKDAITENVIQPGLNYLTNPGEAIKDISNIPGNNSIMRRLSNPPPPAAGNTSTEAPLAQGYDTSRVGSSIMQNPTMNSGAAQALYTGDTDAALAAQYGNTQYAAGGGLMELNPVMNNQGKYVKMQSGMNDNPFTKGIGSLT
tara:strand:- start:336 stop:3725 length:3390 start_codon:yes stop_codon:yes gene_type:complete